MRILLDEDLPRRLAAIVEAPSNRLEHLAPLAPRILQELNHIPARSLRKAGVQPQ